MAAALSSGAGKNAKMPASLFASSLFSVLAESTRDVSVNSEPSRRATPFQGVPDGVAGSSPKEMHTAKHLGVDYKGEGTKKYL